MEISVVVPAFNEAARIGAALEAISGHLAACGAEFEIVCVDDGSTDATAGIVASRAAGDPRIRLVRLASNSGKGAAVREGVLAARGETIFVLDADLSTRPEAIDDARPHLLDGADLVTGSRHCPGAAVEKAQGIVRRSLGKGFLYLARRIADPRSTDITCGFKGFRRAAAQAVFRRSRIDGWAFDAETALIARRLDLVRREVPVTWRNDPDSRVRVLRSVLGSFRDLLRIAVRDARGLYAASAEEKERARTRKPTGV